MGGADMEILVLQLFQDCVIYAGDKGQVPSSGLNKAMLWCRVRWERIVNPHRGEKKKLPRSSQLKSFYSQPIHTENWWVMVDEAQMVQTELFVCSSEPRYFTVSSVLTHFQESHCTMNQLIGLQQEITLVSLWPAWISSKSSEQNWVSV